MSEKIRIKPISPDDHIRLYEIVRQNRNRLIRYFPLTMAELVSLEATKYFIEDCLIKYKFKQMFPFGIHLGTKLIGWINIKNIDFRVLKAELGYYIDGAYEGQGHMTNAIKEVIDYGFEVVQLNKIYLRIGPENIASKNIASKFGFKLEGVLKEEFKIESGSIIDIEYYGLLKANYHG
jgi:ribosomal-protein-serine acetyltransferase